MHTIYLALGSNLGNKIEHIYQAIKLLKEKVQDIQVANLYETKPAYFTDQDIFVNTAVKGQTDLSPEDLLIFVKDIEKKVGRVERFHYGPREVDVDIVFYDDFEIKSENLSIPHALVHERDFVLKPLCDLNPDLMHPTLNKTVKQLLEEIPAEKLTIARKVSMQQLA